MQVQGTDSLVLKHQRYGGPLDCAVKTIKNEGVRLSSFFYDFGAYVRLELIENVLSG